MIHDGEHLSDGEVGTSDGGFHLVYHALGSKETAVVYIDSEGGGIVFLCHVAEHIEGIIASQLLFHRLDHPQPGDILEIAVSAVESALVGEVMKAALLACIGGKSFDTDERPCSGAYVDDILGICRHRNDSGTGVMRCRKDDLCPVTSGLGGDLFGKLSYDVSRFVNLSENSFGIAEPSYHVIIPVAGNGIGQQVIQVFRHHKHPVGFFKILRIVLLHRHKLIYGIEDRLLDTGSCIKLLFGDYLIDFFVHSVISRIAVADGVSDTVSVLVEKREIDAPCVNADIRRAFSLLHALGNSCLDISEKRVGVPDEGAVAVLLHSVRETVHFLDRQPAVFVRPDNVPAA